MSRDANEFLGSGEVTEIVTTNVVTTGVTPLEMQDYVWDDILGYSLATQLDSVRGHLSYNFDEGTVDFNDSADILVNEDAIIMNFQMPHGAKVGTGTIFRPHIHFIQDAAGIPLFKVEYRVYPIGNSLPTAWTLMGTQEAPKVTYVSGRVHNIVPFGNIDASSVQLSGIVQVRIWRDGSNVLDTHVGDLMALFIDGHYMREIMGSKEEYIR